MESGKIKHRKGPKYTLVNNEILNSTDLSWKAKGIMSYLISLPEDWELYKTELVKRSKDGYESMISGWKELEALGYIETKIIKSGNLFSKYEYTINDSRILGFTESGITEPENPQLIITNSKVNTKRINTNNKEAIFSFEDFWQLYPKKVAKEKCLTKFKNLKSNEIQAIKSTLTSFLNYYPFPTYSHPDPLSYLNAKRWQDEIPVQPTQAEEHSVLTKEQQDELDAYFNRF